MFDQQVAARTVWGEARGEGPEGIRAVAHVIHNRKLDGRWGHTLGSVCYWPLQFSCWNPNDPNWEQIQVLQDGDPVLLQCYGAVVNAEMSTEADPTNGATHYYADTISEPFWARGLTPSAHIGHHLFYKGVR